MKIKYAITLVCFIIAFAITLQIKSQMHINATDVTKSRVEDIAARLVQERQKNDSLSTEVSTLRNDLERFKSEAGKNSDASKLLTEKLEKAELAAGMTDVEGKGVVISLSDSKQRNSLDPNAAAVETIHDSDILTLLNELRAAEAEAISLNGQRILATSEIRCAGPSVSVNNVRCFAPFEVLAIGDFEKINSTLHMPEGFMDTVRLWNLECSITKSDKVTIKAYTGPVKNEFAKPITAGNKGVAQ